MEDDKLIIKYDSGEIKEFTLLSIFNIKDKEDDYAIYTDKIDNANKSITIYSGILRKNGDIDEITDKEEILIVNEYIDRILKENT